MNFLLLFSPGNSSGLGSLGLLPSFLATFCYLFQEEEGARFASSIHPSHPIPSTHSADPRSTAIAFRVVAALCYPLRVRAYGAVLDRYRVSHPIIHGGFSDKFKGVPPACGPLLQLATAQAGQGNSQNKT